MPGGLGNIGTAIGGLGGIGGGAAQAAAPLWQRLALGGLLGAGELGNILASHRATQQQDQAFKYANYVASLAKDPAALSRMVLAAERPISASLFQSIGNQVQGDLAQRGLGQAPGIFAQAESQALAPFQQQNYQTALQQVMGALQAGQTGYAWNRPATPQGTDMSSLASLFLRSFGSKGAPGTPQLPTWSTIPTPVGGQIPDPGLTLPPDTAAGIWGGGLTPYGVGGAS